VRLLKKQPEVTYTYATLGEGSSGAVDNGNIYVRLVPKNERSRSVAKLAQALRGEFAKVAGATVTIFESDFGGGFKQIQVQVRGRLAPEARQRASDLAQIPLVVIGPNGAPATVPLGQIAVITSGTGPAIIDHLNRQPVVTVELNTGGRAAGDVSADIQKIVDG